MMKNGREIYDGIESLANEINERNKELKCRLSNINKEIVDIQHYIEFYPLNACQGYAASKMLKDRLCERRSIKDEIQQLESIRTMNVGHIGNGKGRNDLDKLKCKQYHPRVLKELFGGEECIHFNLKEGDAV